MSIWREAGGNRFIPGDADRTELVLAIQSGLHDLHVWAQDTGRTLDIGAITIETRRIPNGNISVDVTGDLPTPPAPESATDPSACEGGAL